MSVDPVTAGPHHSLQSVIDLLRGRNIRAVPVVEQGKLVGIVTDRDVREVAPAYPLFRDEDEIRRYKEQMKASAAMTADPLTVSSDTPLVRAARLLETYRISALPVVDGKKLVGMISVTDLLRVFVEQNERNAA